MGLPRTGQRPVPDRDETGHQPGASWHSHRRQSGSRAVPPARWPQYLCRLRHIRHWYNRYDKSGVAMVGYHDNFPHLRHLYSVVVAGVAASLGDDVMSDQVGIPCLFMRGGTSRGPYFNAHDLPTDVATRDKVLLAAMGSPDKRQIDGLGGGDTLTSKVAIVSKSTRPGIDLDYLFAQVDINRAFVDTAPSCGNMLA